MSHILAIESDRQRRTLLMALIREHVLADVTMVDTVNDAIASFEHRQPDLIVAPPLLTPEDSDRLSSHVKWHADPHVQMLTIFALDMLREAPEERHRFGLFRRRRPLSLGLQYDPAMVGRQIADALDRAQTLREEGRSTLDVRALVRGPSAPLVFEPATTSGTSAAAWALRERAERMPQGGPWKWSVRMPWGSEVELVNISRTGLLLESGSKVSPGLTLELQLNGMGQNCVVIARFVRSDIARVDRLGVRYHAAAQFDEPLAMLAPRAPRASATPGATPQSLAELFTTVVSGLGPEEDSSIRFAHGLCGLIGARDVFIRPTPIAPGHDCESIYFRVSGDDREGMILQVLFDRHRALTTAEFRIMKAASGLASAVLELERASIHDGRLLPAPVATGVKMLAA